MKTHVSLSLFGLLIVAAFIGANAAADDLTSTVTIYAVDPQAAEAFTNTGTFTVRRSGGTNFSQLIFYTLSGTASNGVDYDHLGGTVQMPAGATAASFTVRPIEDSLIEGTETVVARIVASPLDCVTCGYDIGDPAVADILIYDNDTGDTNHPPFIQLNSPQNGAVFTAPATIDLHAYAQDTEDRFFVRVEFFAGANSLGFGTFVPTTCPAPYCPYFALTWSNVPPGRYTITARATDSLGLATTSAPTQITVGDPRSGLYEINSGRYHACCGLGGDLGYDLPSDSQSFVRLEIDQNNSATMTFLGADAQTIFSIVPCPMGPPIPFSFSHGLVFPDRIVFHVDPGPQSYWNYTVSNAPNQLRLDGILGLVRPACADAPDKFSHSNVVATLLASAPQIEGVERQGDLFRFRFSGEAPYDYFVEYASSLAAQNWQSLTNFRAKLGTILATVTDPLSNNAARFYRIRKQPCFCREQ
ncbi:MAG TPA: Ig-like domain-containing protein [Verrucomicrobiae bacterium]|nr:Ig-like domain-containing protein [Verrucomicrobiae bacterium]